MTDECCLICCAPLVPESCYQCMGAGGFHDCGEDTCCCLDPDEITNICEVCEGEGEYLSCSALPHTEAQMAAYRETHQEG